jgi:hypothetical protein
MYNYTYVYIHFREKIEKRIELNMSMAEEIEEKRKNEFLDKQEHFERLRVAHVQQLEQDRYLFVRINTYKDTLIYMNINRHVCINMYKYIYIYILICILYIYF